MNLLAEPADHGVGRSRGGLTSKIHTMVDGRGRPLVLVVTAGQANDSPMLPALLEGLRVPRVGPGRPRTRPTAVLADKAYSSRAHRARLRAAGVTAVIPEPADQIAHRRRRGSAGGRPPAFDAVRYRDRNVVERSYAAMKQWRGLATRYDKHAVNYRAAAVLHAVITWCRHIGDTP
jgi:transposase